MKQHIVPTSPKSTERPQVPQRSNHALIAIIAGLIFGVAGGVVGSIYTQNIIDSIEQVGSSAFFRFSQSTTTAASMDSVRDSIATLYATDGNSFRPDQFVDYALAVSTDGWFVISDEFFHPEDSLYIRLSSGDALPVKRIVERKDMGLVFVHISRVDVKPIAIADDRLELGAKIVAFAAGSDREFFVNEIVNKLTDLDVPISTISFVRHAYVNERGYSAPVFNDAHECIGWQRTDGSIVPAFLFTSAFVRIDMTTSSALNIRTVSVATLAESERTEKKYPDVGWLVTETVGALIKNDVIVSIDGQRVEKNDDLSHAIARRAPGAELTLGIVRDGASQDILIMAW